MSILESLRRYGALSPEQKAFVESKRIDAIMPIDSWIANFAILADYDAAGDASRKLLGWGIFLGVVLTIVLGASLGPIAAAVGGLLTVGVIVLFVMMKRRDVPNGLREFVLPLLRILREDVPQSESFHLALDLTGPRSDAKRVRSDDLTRGSGYPKVKQTIYRDPWMQADATLADGTNVTWEISDHVREREITKRNPRGKIKTKTKYKVKRAIVANVGLKKKSYTVDSRIVDDGARLRESEGRSTVRLRRLREYHVLGAHPELDDVLGLLTAAYQRASRRVE